MEYPVPQLVEINNDENRFDHKIHDYATFEELDEVQKENDALPVLQASTDKPFIQANTIAISLEDIKNTHLVPVFIKDNEPVISHADFIETMFDVVSKIYPSETI